MTQAFSPIHTAELTWNEGLPFSPQYGDVYFSNEGGLNEARHVFLAGNKLEQRLAQAKHFTVGETGFGSGLNFMALWQLWEEVAPANARLHFFSAEKHPLRREDMARIHALFPELESYAALLREALPLPVPGFHRLIFADGRITLTLMYGDALDMLKEQDAQADAWFLDGFAPRLNPQLWTVELAQELRRLSASGATLATFSTSQSTMEGLSAAGFIVGKIPGFGRKRHMLSGEVAGEWHPASSVFPVQARVVGGGVAGASTAYALARRGCEVILEEEKQTAYKAASTNPCAVFYPGVARGWLPETAFYFMGYSFSRRLVQEMAASHPIAHDFCGMLLFPKPSDAAGRLEKAVEAMQPQEGVFHRVDRAEASLLAGVEMSGDGVFFPHGGWVDLDQYRQALLSHERIRTAPVSTKMPVVLCHGWQTSEWLPDCGDYIHPVMGQITPVEAIPGSVLEGLRCVLSYGGYMAPAGDGIYRLGATYERGVTLEEADLDKGAEENIAKLSLFLARAAEVRPAGQSWAGMRPVSRDRMPMVGRWRQEGIYLSMAHASRGLLSCGIAGEYIASLLYDEPSPLPRSTAKILDPLRFERTRE